MAPKNILKLLLRLTLLLIPSQFFKIFSLDVETSSGETEESNPHLSFRLLG